jgi:hypothetical protein
MDDFLEFEHMEGDWFDDKTHHEILQRVMHRSLGGARSQRALKEGLLQALEVPGDDLTLMAELAFSTERKIYLESVSPPIYFLD